MAGAPTHNRMPSRLICSYGTPLEEIRCGLYSINPELEGFNIVGRIRGQDFNGCKVQCGLTSFVDDVASGSAALCANMLLDRMNHTDELIEHKLAVHNIKQNEAKSESLCYFAGKKSTPESQAWYRDNLHNITMEARYLGPHLSYRGSMTTEIELRIAAATSAWQAFCSFWGYRTDIAIKRVIFRGVVTSTLLSGLMIAVFSDGEKHKLDAAHLELARRSLAGLGRNKFKRTDGGKKYISERSGQVRQYMS